MTSLTAATANAAPAASGAGEKTGATALAERDTFLRLLVAQMQNQDPLNPQDPIEFVSQLAQFSQLETLLEMRSSLEGIEQALTTPPPAEDSTRSSEPSA